MKEGSHVEPDAGEGPGYLRGVLESMWFRKLDLLFELLGFKSPAPQLPVNFKKKPTMPESLTMDLSHTKPENKILGFSGSPRKNGNSDILLKTIISGAKQLSIPTAAWNLTDVQFKGCIGCEKCRKTKICTGLIDGMTSLYPKLYSSKGLILVSPTHNYNITSWMKAFIDRLYCFYSFENNRPRSWSSQLENQNRKAVVAAICEQKSVEDMGFTLEAMKAPLKALGYEIIGELSVFRIFDKAKVKTDEKAMNDAYELGQKLANILK